MFPDVHNETVRHALYVFAFLAGNIAVSGISWRLAGAKRRGIRLVGRITAAFFALANVGVVFGCLFHLLRGRADWFYVGFLIVGFVFAYRIGGATIGRYP
jgi:phosphoglycerol transferase MdoB-like AlkP superfamily enzyme